MKRVIIIKGLPGSGKSTWAKALIDHSLFMRPTSDTRKDWVVKRFNIKFVLDDRNRVVEPWRSLGLTCFQVADGDF